MNSTALNIKKAEAIRIIQNTENEQALDKLLSYAHDILHSASLPVSPCQMTVDELRTEVIESIEDIKNGNTISHDKVFEEIEKILTS